MKTYKTFLPVFTGFYGTIFEPCEDSEIEYINEKREELGLKPATWDEMKFDYNSYRVHISKQCCNHIENVLNNDLDIKCEVLFEEIQSPREYNFTNDSINCTIKVDKNAVLKYLIDHKEELKQYFLDKFTSYDGFISFHSNDIDEWIKELDWNEMKEDKIGWILEAILLNEDNEAEQNMYYSLCDTQVECMNFEELTTISE